MRWYCSFLSRAESTLWVEYIVLSPNEFLKKVSVLVLTVGMLRHGNTWQKNNLSTLIIYTRAYACVYIFKFERFHLAACAELFGWVLFLLLKLNLTFKVEYYSVCVCLGNTPFFLTFPPNRVYWKFLRNYFWGGFVEYIQNRVLKFCLSVFTVPCVRKVLFTG